MTTTKTAGETLALEKLTAAQRKLQEAHHRIAQLDGIALSAQKEAQTFTTNLFYARNGMNVVQPQKIDAYETSIAEQIAIRDAARAEKIALESSLQALIIDVDSLTRVANTVHQNAAVVRLESAQKAWADAIQPHMHLLETYRIALADLGSSLVLPLAQHVLSAQPRRI